MFELLVRMYSATLEPYLSEERGVLGVGNIPTAILPDVKIIAL